MAVAPGAVDEAVHAAGFGYDSAALRRGDNSQLSCLPDSSTDK